MHAGHVDTWPNGTSSMNADMLNVNLAEDAVSHKFFAGNKPVQHLSLPAGPVQYLIVLSGETFNTSTLSVRCFSLEDKNLKSIN